MTSSLGGSELPGATAEAYQSFSSEKRAGVGRFASLRFLSLALSHAETLGLAQVRRWSAPPWRPPLTGSERRSTLAIALVRLLSCLSDFSPAPEFADNMPVEITVKAILFDMYVRSRLKELSNPALIPIRQGRHPRRLDPGGQLRSAVPANSPADPTSALRLPRVQPTLR